MRIKLRKGDLAYLGRLKNGPLEIGAIPGETVERLTARGLVVQVLGSCEITRSGQLTYHRQQFLRTPRGGVTRIRQATELPHWLMRLATETAGQFRQIHEINGNQSGGNTHGDKETD